MTDDEIARRRAERDQHPSTLPKRPRYDDLPEMCPDESYTQHIDDLPSVVRARLDALQNVAAEVADELVRRGVDDLAERLRGALP